MQRLCRIVVILGAVSFSPLFAQFPVNLTPTTTVVKETVNNTSASGTYSNPSVGTYAKSDGIHLRLTARAATADAARELIAPLEAVQSSCYIHRSPPPSPDKALETLTLSRC